MFENYKDFYPTPEWVADKMLEGIDWLMKMVGLMIVLKVRINM